MIPLTIRFYGILNDFLKQSKKNKNHKIIAFNHQTIKDIIESIGIPHIEAGVILANNKSVNFRYRPASQDKIQIYPFNYPVKQGQEFHLQPKPLKNPKFLLDIHLGKLARNLRLCGFDAFLFNGELDAELVHQALKARRIVLTRDLELLKRGTLKRGYWIRNDTPGHQLTEVIKRYNLFNRLQPFHRCLICNGKLKMISKKKIVDQLPAKVREYFNEFFQCSSCGKLYWKGSHYSSMKRKIEKLERLNKKNSIMISG
jgi:uncharacterized protein